MWNFAGRVKRWNWLNAAHAPGGYRINSRRLRSVHYSYLNVAKRTVFTKLFNAKSSAETHICLGGDCKWKRFINRDTKSLTRLKVVIKQREHQFIKVNFVIEKY